MNILIKLKNFLFIPYKLLILLDYDNRFPRFGLRTNKEDRIDITLKYAKGRLLDIGCGQYNSAIKKYVNGYGIDVYPWQGIDMLCDTTKIPFKDESFDSVSFIASFNHVPRQKVDLVVKEVYRVLKNDGLLLITNATPLVGYVNHEIAHRFDDIDRKCRGISSDECYGYWHKDLVRLIASNSFTYLKRVPFIYYLSYLYIFKKKA